MKSFVVLAAVAALALVNAEECDYTKLLPLLQDPDVRTCHAETGLTPPVPPDETILPKLCGNEACKAGLVKLKALKVGDCTVVGYRIETDFINPIEAYCTNKTPTPTPTSAPPTTAPTTAPPPPTITPITLPPSPTTTPTAVPVPVPTKPTTAPTPEPTYIFPTSPPDLPPAPTPAPTSKSVC